MNTQFIIVSYGCVYNNIPSFIPRQLSVMSVGCTKCTCLLVYYIRLVMISFHLSHCHACQGDIETWSCHEIVMSWCCRLFFLRGDWGSPVGENLGNPPHPALVSHFPTESVSLQLTFVPEKIFTILIHFCIDFDYS